MKKLFYILATLLPCQIWAQVAVQPQATLFVGDEAILSIDGGVNNDGSLQNLGEVTFTGDWTNTNTYNDGGTGSLEANGPGSQTISNNDQAVGTLDVNAGSEVTVLGNSLEITDELILNNGVVRLGNNTSLIIGEDAEITGGSQDSFIEGTVIQRGGGLRRYPLGIGSDYLPLIFEDIPNNGTGLEMSVGAGLFSDAGIDPRPGSRSVGVSEFHYWEVNILNGVFDGSITDGAFENANLDPDSFTIVNDFTFQRSIPALMVAEALDSAFNTVRTDRIGSPTDYDSLNNPFPTFGRVITRDTLGAALDGQAFIAVGLSALAPAEGIIYVPTAFSPVALNPEDRTFRVFADGIRPENFIVTLYNQFGVEVYNEDNFERATTMGWDGVNPKNGKEEPVGSYTYYVRFQNELGDFRSKTGVVLLIR